MILFYFIRKVDPMRCNISNSGKIIAGHTLCAWNVIPYLIALCTYTCPGIRLADETVRLPATYNVSTRKRSSLRKRGNRVLSLRDRAGCSRCQRHPVHPSGSPLLGRSVLFKVKVKAPREPVASASRSRSSGRTNCDFIVASAKTISNIFEITVIMNAVQS